MNQLTAIKASTLLNIFLFVLLSMVATAQNQAPELKTIFKNDRIVLPLSYRNEANPMVEVMINGKGPYKFMFETGGGGLGARLDAHVFEELNMQAVDSVTASDGSITNLKTFPIARIDKIDLGGYEIMNATAMVRNYNRRV